MRAAWYEKQGRARDVLLVGEVPGSVANRHRQELTDFAAQIGTDGGRFSALTYQELLARMVPFVGQDDSEYVAYLRDRYMSDAVVS